MKMQPRKIYDSWQAFCNFHLP